MTSSHIRRVQSYSLALAEALGVTDPSELKAIEAGDGTIVARVALGIPPGVFIREVFDIVTLSDFITGIVKTLVFGWAVVVGAGHAGLAISQVLRRSGIEHIVLERGRVGERWRRHSGS